MLNGTFSKPSKLVVWAKLAGKNVRCIVDTGCGSILWPRSLSLPVHLGTNYAISSDVEGHSVPIKTCDLDTVDLRGYRIQGVQTFAVETGSLPAQSTLSEFVLLGNAAFDRVVLTIDYHKKQLILRQPEYNFAQQPHRACDRIIPFGWSSSGPNSQSRQPFIEGIIEGKPAHLEMDTGWGGDVIGIAKQFYYDKRLHLAQFPSTFKTPAGQTKTSYIQRIAFSFANVNECFPAVLVSNLYPGLDAVFGTQVLQHFRVTIDYPRRKILLEPYPL